MTVIKQLYFNRAGSEIRYFRSVCRDIFQYSADFGMGGTIYFVQIPVQTVADQILPEVRWKCTDDGCGVGAYRSVLQRISCGSIYKFSSPFSHLCGDTKYIFMDSIL